VTWGRRLLERFRRGETAALDEVYRAYADSVARVVSAALRRFGGGAATWPAIAEDLGDLVQEVFTRAFDPRTRRSFDGLREYGPFLCQIARNVTVDYLRRDSRYVLTDIDRIFNEAPLQPSVPDLSDDFAEREALTLVTRYLAALPADLQRVHDLLYVRGLSEREAAGALGVGRQVIRTLGARLRDGLRQQLADQRPADGQDAPPPTVARARIGSS
jgi:RNA polymerase sigma factor (sigma-70 family)